MTVWIMNHYASSMFRDKAGRHYWFAKKLEERGYKVTVFCASEYHDRDGGIDTEGKLSIAKPEGATPFVFVKTNHSKGNGIDRVKNMVNFYRHLFPVAKHYAKQNGKPDVIIASSVHPLTMVAGVRIAKKLRVPCVCEVRDLWPEAVFSFGKAKEKSMLGRMLVAGEHWIYRKADALIFTKEGDTDYLKEHEWTTAQGGDIDLSKCYYINNGVNLKTYHEQILSEQFNDSDLLDETKFNVVYTGIIRPVNNVGNLLDCAGLLMKKTGYDDVQFLIYGDGSELEKLQQRVKDEQLENVKLKGFVARKYVPFVLSRSSVNILNYAQNQFNWTRGNSSNKLFEYMASGKPIISTVKMGYSIINQNKCGIELDTCTPEAFAEAIVKFHDMDASERDQFGRNAAKGAQSFDFESLVNKLETVIKSVVHE